MDCGDGAKDERPPYVERCRTLIVTPNQVKWIAPHGPSRLRQRLGRSLGRLFGRFLGCFLIHDLPARRTHRPTPIQRHDDHARANWTKRSVEHLNRCFELEARPKKEDSDCPWKQRNLDTATEVVRRWVAARNALNTAQAAFKQEEAALKYALQEGLLDENFDEMSGEFDFSSQGVVFTRQTRRSWAMDCYSESLQQPFAQSRKCKEPHQRVIAREVRRMIEIWKDIPGHEGRYQASRHGQIRRSSKTPREGVEPTPYDGYNGNKRLSSSDLCCTTAHHLRVLSAATATTSEPTTDRRTSRGEHVKATAPT